MTVEDDGLRRRATRSIGWVVVERWGSRLLSLAVLAVLTRLLSPEDFGLISLATSIIAIFAVFVDAGFSRALVQRRSLGPKHASTAFWASLALAIGLCGSVILAAPALAAVLGEPELAPVMQALSLVMPLSALGQTPAALLERTLDFKPLSIRTLAGAVVGASVAIPIGIAGGGIWALVAQALVAAFVSTVVLWASTSWRPKFEFSLRALRDLWAVGATILAIDLLDAAQANIDKIVIGVFFTPEQLGYYFLAQRIGTILIELVTTVISRVTLTTFSRVQDDLPRLNRIFRQLTFVSSAISVAIFGLLATLAPQVVDFVAGAGWGAAVPIIWILAPGWAIGAVMYFDRNVLLATAKTRSAFLLALLQSVVGIVLVFAFLPFGVLGVAFSRLARFIVWPVRLAVLRRAIGLRVGRYLLQLVRCVAAAVVPLAAILLLQSTPWATWALPMLTFAVPAALIFAVSYLPTLWWFAGAENRAVLSRAGTDILRRVRTKKP